MLTDSPIHPILSDAQKFVIVRFDYHNDPNDWQNSYVDLHLRRDRVQRRLRFLRPRSLKIEDGFPNPTHGMVIFDISNRHWDDIRVEVSDFEASPGRITFYAADVVDLDPGD